MSMVDWGTGLLLLVPPIRATGTGTVVASCDNCRHQLGQLNEHYKLNVNVMGLAELMVNAIVP
jgi:hypothetical protein